ncbi:MAG: hypothetical protein AB1689_20065 [Thermodesulfobacteriota bacterium]
MGQRERRGGARGALAGLAVLAATTAAFGDTFDDPFAYCRAVGTIDAPDARWHGPAVPRAVARGLQQAFGVAPTEPLTPFERGTSWRCMDGEVYACNVGANLPCTAKPSADPQPSDGMRSWCAENPGSDFVPMYVTGHDTIYDWSCDGTTPKRGERTSELDARGFIARIWYRLTPER